MTKKQLNRFTEFDLQVPNGVRRPSPGICIYCFAKVPDLTDEHVIPYALAANTLILEKSCCGICQQIIQPYEQDVLKKQLGNFRAQTDAPTRNRKSRQPAVQYEFAEFDSAGQIVRDIGSRTLPLADAPIVINLWSSPEPQYGLQQHQTANSVGIPWSYFDRESIQRLCNEMAHDTGAKIIGLKLGEVNRLHFLRFLAKVAHAYTATMLGLDGFEPLLLDVILKRSDDLNRFVGDIALPSPFYDSSAHTFQISLGEIDGGPLAGCLVVRIQLYPMLNSPTHIIVVGQITALTLDRLADAEQNF